MNQDKRYAPCPCCGSGVEAFISCKDGHLTFAAKCGNPSCPGQREVRCRLRGENFDVPFDTVIKAMKNTANLWNRKMTVNGYVRYDFKKGEWPKNGKV